MRAFLASLACVAVLISGCAAGNAKIASRKGYVRFPEKHYAFGEKAEIGLKIRGEASYYGPGFHGKQTASGEIFDQEDYNDRGPYVDGRILDLSVAAGKKIGLDKVGHAEVVATVVQ